MAADNKKKPPKIQGTKWDKLTPEQRDGWVDRARNFMRELFGETNVGKVDMKIVQWIYENDANQDIFNNYIRDNYPKKYLTSIPAKQRGNKFKDELRAIFPDLNIQTDPELTAAMERWMSGKGTAASALGEFISNVVTKTKAWRALPNSDLWEAWRKANSVNDLTNFGAVMKQFQDDIRTLKSGLEQSWKGVYGVSSELPNEYVAMALMGGWDADSVQWNDIIVKNPRFASSTVALERDKVFTQNWESVFGTDVPVDQALKEKFRTSDGKWDSFFNLYIKDSPAFAKKFPDYAAWENRQHAAGHLEGSPDASVDAYLQQRQQYIDDYKDTFGYNSEPPPGLIDKAMQNDWSTAQFADYVKHNDPNYATTDEYKGKVESFNNWYSSVFGEGASDPGMANFFAASGNNDPSSMWNYIKNSAAFQSQFPNWDAFAQAQTAAGVDVTANPLLYNEYKTAFKAAFQNVGMEVPQDMERQFFASGVDTGEFKSNLEDYQRTAQSFNWQAGGQADLATAAGIGNKTAGGALKQKMQAALEQHRRYANSTWNDYDASMNKAGQMTRKI